MPKIRPVADNSPRNIETATPGQAWDAGQRPAKVVMPSGRIITHEQWCRVLRKLCRDYQITPRQAATASGAIVSSDHFDRVFAANNTREKSDERKARTGKRGWTYGMGAGQKYIHTDIDRQGDREDLAAEREAGIDRYAAPPKIGAPAPPKIGAPGGGGSMWSQMMRGARRSGGGGGRFAAIQNAMRGGRARMLEFKTAASPEDMDRGRAALMRRGLISGQIGQVGPIVEIEGVRRRTSELK